MSWSHGSYEKRQWCTYLCCTECPADFQPLESVNGCYKVVNSNLAWSIAALECRAQHPNAHLLVINNAQEQSALGTLLDMTKRQFIVHVLVYCLTVDF